MPRGKKKTEEHGYSYYERKERKYFESTIGNLLERLGYILNVEQQPGILNVKVNKKHLKYLGESFVDMYDNDGKYYAKVYITGFNYDLKANSYAFNMNVVKYKVTKNGGIDTDKDLGYSYICSSYYTSEPRTTLELIKNVSSDVRYALCEALGE